MPTMIKRRKTSDTVDRRLMLHGCPRCQGDLFHDDYEDEFYCLQCGRRVDPALLVTPAAIEEVSKAA